MGDKDLGVRQVSVWDGMYETIETVSQFNVCIVIFKFTNTYGMISLFIIYLSGHQYVVREAH